MMYRGPEIDRREFLKAASALGVTLVTRPWQKLAEGSPSLAAIPKRPFGRTGYYVSTLALGGMFDIPNNLLLLKKCLEWGVTYWDTADCYEGGRSEKGIGQFFAQNPGARKQVFLVTKSDARDPEGMSRLLSRSLERMQTEWIDLYLLHGVRSPSELTDEVRRWAEQAKREGKIRLFGFSTHANMAHLLQYAAKLGWIDGIMFTYNFRLMNDPEMESAVNACFEAGIGLTAMKTQGTGPVPIDSLASEKLKRALAGVSLTPEQAKLVAVWSNPRIASICSQMPNLRILTANVSAARLMQQFDTASIRRILCKFAQETAHCFCAGCAQYCEADRPNLRVSDIMRCAMYWKTYGDVDMARRLWKELHCPSMPGPLDPLWAHLELQCPHALPIRSIVSELQANLGLTG